MNNISDNELDRMFREAAEKHQSTFDEGAWTAMAEKLDNGEDGGMFYYRFLGGIVGLFLTAAVLIWWFSPEPAVTLRIISENGSAVSPPKSEQPGEENNFDPSVFGSEDFSTEGTGHVVRDAERRSVAEGDALNNGAQVHSPNTTAGNDQGTIERELQRPQPTGPFSSNAVQGAPDLLEGFGYPEWMNTFFTADIEKVTFPERERDRQKDRKWALAFSFAPDLTSVGYFNPDRPGSNYGVKVEYFIAPRWSLSSGALYARKIYASEESATVGGYYGGAASDRIEGDCRIIDIPLKINYYPLRKSSHSLYFSFGSSSYVMLNEKYDFNRIINGYETSWSQEIKNENEHWFGILDLSMGYERRVSSNLFLQVEPFFKIPISGIGEGEVDLVSTGVFLNFKYHIK